METTSEASAAVGDRPAGRRRIAWLELVLVFAGQALFFQVFPETWARVTSGVVRPVLWVIDVRNWNIVGYIVALSVVLVVLLAAKIWKDRLEWDADLRRWSRLQKRRQ